jgi:hypothetical protein
METSHRRVVLPVKDTPGDAHLIRELQRDHPTLRLI